MFHLISERIKLVPLTLNELMAMLESWENLERSMELNHIKPDIDPTYQLELDDALMNFWLPKVEENPDHWEWFTAWQIIHKEHNVMIGGIGFSGLPNDQGESMVGYHIDRNYQRKGYASEALEAMCQWGFQNPALESILATTFIDNTASQKVLLKNGFLREKEEGELVWFRKRKP